MMKNIEFNDFTITFREILVCIAITLILIGCGFLISGKIKDNANEENEKYYKALKINYDEEMFKYAIKTNIGYTLAQGKVQAIDGVKINDIDGVYFKIIKEKEEYTKHYKKVEHTRIVGNTTETYYTYEEYWTWDYKGKEEFHTQKFKFLGEEFDYGTINFYNKRYKETKSAGYHIRFNYYVIPFEFDGTLFTYIDNNTINKNTFLFNTIDNIIVSKEKESKSHTIGFWFIWSIFILIIDFGYMYLDNNYLEDKEEKIKNVPIYKKKC